MLDAIANAISESTGLPVRQLTAHSVSGGCINQSYAITDGTHTYFLKLNTPAAAANFAAESEALNEIAGTHSVRVPLPICHGTTPTHAFLVLEYIALTAPANAALGTALAQLHRNTAPGGNFGWHRDNTIGATPQPNPWTADWAGFFTEHRLGHQLAIAAASGHTFSRSADLLGAVHSILTNHQPAPSLLHGDLWGGNAASAPDGTPVVFDPATYYGDRETDLAFTHMFGGFPPGFYTAYQKAFPLPPGHESRRPIYNLYHLINHHNLFAGHYTPQVQAAIDSLLL